MLACLIGDAMNEKETVDGLNAAMELAVSREVDVNYVRQRLIEVADEIGVIWPEDEDEEE